MLKTLGVNREKERPSSSPILQRLQKGERQRRAGHLPLPGPAAHVKASGCSSLGAEHIWHFPCPSWSSSHYAWASDNLQLTRNLTPRSGHSEDTHRATGSQWQRKEIRPESYFLTQPRQQGVGGPHQVSLPSNSAAGEHHSAGKYFLSHLLEPISSL